MLVTKLVFKKLLKTHHFYELFTKIVGLRSFVGEKHNCFCYKKDFWTIITNSKKRERWYFRFLIWIYQTAHFCTGFIALPSGQLKSEANWGILANGPRTRKRDGEWAPVRMRSFKLSGRDFWHQTLAAPSQNNWRTLKQINYVSKQFLGLNLVCTNSYLYSLKPGRRCSTWSQFSKPLLWRVAYLIYAL